MNGKVEKENASAAYQSTVGGGCPPPCHKRTKIHLKASMAQCASKISFVPFSARNNSRPESGVRAGMHQETTKNQSRQSSKPRNLARGVAQNYASSMSRLHGANESKSRVSKVVVPPLNIGAKRSSVDGRVFI